MQKLTGKEARLQAITFLEKLPDESLLKAAKTHQQTDYWERRRNSNYLLAQCWKARFSDGNDPLIEGLEKGELDPLIYEATWISVDYWETVWGLCQLGERYLKAAAKEAKVKYPFNSAHELFRHILSYSENGLYSECLRPYSQEYSMKEIKKMCRLEIKKSKEGLNPIENKTLDTLINKYARPENQKWKRLLLFYCRKNSKHNYAISLKVENYDKNTERRSRLALTMTNRRDPTTNSFPRSFVWKNGEQLNGNPQGTYG